MSRLAAWSGVALSAVLIFWLLAPVLAPFMVAAVLAYVLNPLVLQLVRVSGGRLPHLLAVVLVEGVALLALLGIVLLLVPILVREWPLLQQQIPLLFDKLDASLTPWLAQMGISVSLDLSELKSQLVAYLSANREDWWAPLMSSLKLGGSAALALAGFVVLVPVALFYLLKDWARLLRSSTDLVPPAWRSVFDGFMGECDTVLGEYLRGQLLVMLCLAVYYALGLWLFGLELALPIGIFTGLAVFVPYLGFGLGLVLALLAGLLQLAPGQAVLMLAVVYGLGQLIESFVLTPRLVGERIGLHPLAVILSLMAFGQLMGFVGVLIALPASAVLLVGLRRLRCQYLHSDLYRNSGAADDEQGPGKA
ncbi:AI-2E family transporter [Limnohabitans sp. MMS-10A-160]|uniref:AI-2E family transporter n=1 Tax=unclassified Limnohabitans TaxID=2626134 RepID=UPI000D346A86|nr:MULTISPECIES: AI-2E family transporter [unclassified Limnohabitans]PUE22454.1 AI-2E family transporter [Limnohabitans sp. MMS-10A-192]PUE27442.1 AI-2E family transporter [Limnohabitans sp. MMS-10A-160]